MMHLLLSLLLSLGLSQATHRHARLADHTSVSDCAQDEVDRMDCGYYGIAADECASRDCCWKESGTSGIPWCFHTISNTPGVCSIAEGAREDCGYYGIKNDECNERGCCWQPSEVPNAPWCYTPSGPMGSGENCGSPAILPAVTQRVLDGVEAIPHSWPWQVSLREEGPNFGSHYCGGSIIAPRWVISAGHCADAVSYENASLLVGLHDQTELEVAIPMKVAEYFVHPNLVWDRNLNMVDYDYDYLLIKLEEEIEYGPAISPVCLPSFRENLPEGTLCYTSGWGTLNYFQLYDPEKLQQLMLPLIYPETCGQEDWFNHTFTEHIICAGYEEREKSPCNGDYGDPLVCFVEGYWVLHGIFSWARFCGIARTPIVYANVPVEMEWIESIMAENS